eukprot:3000576-Rhodomonas_salina.1
MIDLRTSRSAAKSRRETANRAKMLEDISTSTWTRRHHPTMALICKRWMRCEQAFAHCARCTRAALAALFHARNRFVHTAMLQNAVLRQHMARIFLPRKTRATHSCHAAALCLCVTIPLRPCALCARRFQQHTCAHLAKHAACAVVIARLRSRAEESFFRPNASCFCLRSTHAQSQRSHAIPSTRDCCCLAITSVNRLRRVFFTVFACRYATKALTPSCSMARRLAVTTIRDRDRQWRRESTYERRVRKAAAVFVFDTRCLAVRTLALIDRDLRACSDH